MLNTKRLSNLIITTVFLCLDVVSFSQINDLPSLVYIEEHLSFSLKFKASNHIISKGAFTENKNQIFLDSLGIKASKNRLTKKLYDFVVITPDTTTRKVITGSGESDYQAFSGKKIRKIIIRRLNVFGFDINNPDINSSSGIRDVLNKTHVNTNEFIIRKNLIFSSGDTISPIVLSDNERILRDLSFIDDARVNVINVSENEADIVVITKDVYSLGGYYEPLAGLNKGKITVFESNLLGMGHEFGIDVPYDAKASDSPGLGLRYIVDNIAHSFINLNINYLQGLGQKTYGFDLSRNLFSSGTKYAGGISIKHSEEKVLLDTLTLPEPFRYNFQDYWLSRSFIFDRQKATRAILGARYTNNSVFDRPFILPDSYHWLQNYRLYLGTIAFSVQKYYKTNLLYGYGRTEDIPYGGLLKVTTGREINEFRNRNYAAAEISYGGGIGNFGYVYSSTGLAAFIIKHDTQQGILSFRLKYFTNLLPAGRNMIRNFVRIDYTRGFDRDAEEHLRYFSDNGFSGFRNDSVRGTQRLTINLESVVFSPLNLYGLRFAFFGFADFSALAGTNQLLDNGHSLSGLGLGIRVRNDNLVFKTFQLRLGFFPSPPPYSKIDYLTISGEQLLEPDNFEPGPPSMIPYR